MALRSADAKQASLWRPDAQDAAQADVARAAFLAQSCFGCHARPPTFDTTSLADLTLELQMEGTWRYDLRKGDAPELPSHPRIWAEEASLAGWMPPPWDRWEGRFTVTMEVRVMLSERRKKVLAVANRWLARPAWTNLGQLITEQHAPEADQQPDRMRIHEELAAIVEEHLHNRQRVLPPGDWSEEFRTGQSPEDILWDMGEMIAGRVERLAPSYLQFMWDKLATSSCYPDANGDLSWDLDPVYTYL